jgi:hypothetical protein
MFVLFLFLLVFRLRLHLLQRLFLLRLLFFLSRACTLEHLKVLVVAFVAILKMEMDTGTTHVSRKTSFVPSVVNCGGTRI